MDYKENLFHVMGSIGMTKAGIQRKETRPVGMHKRADFITNPGSNGSSHNRTIK